MKYVLSLLALSLFVGNIEAKYIDTNYICQESEIMILDNSLKAFPGIIGHDTGSFYVLRQDYVNFVERYNKDLLMTDESEYLKVDYKLKDRQFGKLVYFKDSLYMFYTESKFLQTNLFVKTIDKETLQQNGKERLICEMPHFKSNFPDIFFKLSLLQNKLLVVFKTDALLQKTIKFDFFVFDSGLQKVWSKTDFIQYNHHAPREMTFDVDEDGNIHILSLIYQIKLINHLVAKDALKNEYLVVSYLNNGEDVIDNRISLEDSFIRGIRLMPGENGSYVCAGFFSHLYRFGIKGSFFVTNNTPTKNNVPVLYYNFEDELIDDIPDVNKSEKTEEIYSYKVKDLVYRKNGNIILFGEQVYDQSYDNNNDIIIIAFDKFGNKLWGETVKKVQSGNEYVSYKVVAPVTENDVCILYNENSKNELDLSNEKYKSFHFSTSSNLILIRINSFGDISKENILSRTKKEVIPDPEKTYDMRDGNIVMYANRYRKYKYIKLSLFNNINE